MEIEYFLHPKADWEPVFDGWLNAQEDFLMKLGVSPEDIRRREHDKEKLSHYSRKTVDIEYKFPFGYGELYGLAHRGDFDLTQHANATGAKLEYLDPITNERYVPHVLEPTFGVERTLLVAILAAYHKEEVEGGERVVLKFPPAIAPVKVAVFPLLKNKPELVSKAREVYDLVRKSVPRAMWDDNGNVGKRYRRQDEIGTPFCITIDFDTLEDDSVTLRDRDTMKQERVPLTDLIVKLQAGLAT
jgi:glycyl-tRNA synthetase